MAEETLEQYAKRRIVECGLDYDSLGPVSCMCVTTNEDESIKLYSDFGSTVCKNYAEINSWLEMVVLCLEQENQIED